MLLTLVPFIPIANGNDSFTYEVTFVLTGKVVENEDPAGVVIGFRTVLGEAGLDELIDIGLTGVNGNVDPLGNGIDGDGAELGLVVFKYIKYPIPEAANTAPNPIAILILVSILVYFLR